MGGRLAKAKPKGKSANANVIAVLPSPQADNGADRALGKEPDGIQIDDDESTEAPDGTCPQPTVVTAQRSTMPRLSSKERIFGISRSSKEKDRNEEQQPGEKRRSTLNLSAGDSAPIYFAIPELGRSGELEVSPGAVEKFQAFGFRPVNTRIDDLSHSHNVRPELVLDKKRNLFWVQKLRAPIYTSGVYSVGICAFESKRWVCLCRDAANVSSPSASSDSYIVSNLERTRQLVLAQAKLEAVPKQAAEEAPNKNHADQGEVSGVPQPSHSGGPSRKKGRKGSKRQSSKETSRPDLEEDGKEAGAALVRGVLLIEFVKTKELYGCVELLSNDLKRDQNGLGSVPWLEGEFQLDLPNKKSAKYQSGMSAVASAPLQWGSEKTAKEEGGYNQEAFTLRAKTERSLRRASTVGPSYSSMQRKSLVSSRTVGDPV